MSIDKKNPAAVSLGKRRWAGSTAEERSAAMSALGLRRSKKLGAKERRRIAGLGGAAIAGKKRKPGGGRKKKAAEPEKSL